MLSTVSYYIPIKLLKMFIMKKLLIRHVEQLRCLIENRLFCTTNNFPSCLYSFLNPVLKM